MIATLDKTEVRHQLLMRLADARSQTDRLFEIVRPDSLYERPIPERHRIIFYLGHLEAFDWNLFRDRIAGLQVFNNEFDRLFAFGIDPVGGGLPSDHPIDWPSLDDVRYYNRKTRERLDAALDRAVLCRAEPHGLKSEFSINTLLNVTVEHRLMHAETFAYMLHQLPLERKASPELPPAIISPQFTPQMIEIPSGAATLGLSRNLNGEFGWDNEYEAHEVFVPEFAIDQYKVTNWEYLQFVQEGGYEEPAFWSEADWRWKAEGNISQPMFWKQSDNRWHYRTMFREVPLPPQWPVYVSYAEANAYARWARKSLPSEAQWHRAAYGTPEGPERAYPWGSEHPAQEHGNFNLQSWDPSSVNAYPEGHSAFGAADLLGNGWEWTSTPFEPFPGFQPFPFYAGYSANFFDGKHFVLKGGSTRTASCMLRRSFRNWFQPHYPYAYAGFRCVSN
jgi:iron(II)-dependent oxidoreductase